MPAKVNLHLGVGPLRADGYHEVITVFHAVDLYDTVTVRPASRIRLAVRGEDAAAIPADTGNLAWRAAVLYAARRGGPQAFDIVIDKRIPVAGGMAGGSADAAATLVACAELNEDREPLDALAAELGSDVAFGLHGGTALATGRGERVAPLPPHAPLPWVLACADYGIAAAEAYRELDRLRAGRVGTPAPPDALLAALAGGDVATVAAQLHNDLQPAALSLHPRLAATLAAGTAAGAAGGIVSGSGPTCAFLCPDPGTAATVAEALAPLCRVARAVTGPAAGAHVAPAVAP